MTDPFAVLELTPDSDDAAIRRRYLELVRVHSPERDPERFAAVRAAYEELSSPVERLRRRLFMHGSSDNFAAILNEVRCTRRSRRPSVDEMLTLARKHA